MRRSFSGSDLVGCSGPLSKGGFLQFRDGGPAEKVLNFKLLTVEPLSCRPAVSDRGWGGMIKG